MKKFLVALLLGTSLFANADIVTVPIPGAPGLSVTVGTGVNALPLQDIRNTPGAQNITMGDDDWRNVPLQFQFPYFGKTFTNSWMLSNGAVTFQDPTQNAWGMCCQGENLTTLRDTRYNYTIFPLWADLIANGGSHWVKSEATQATYGWYGVAEYYNNNRQSFEVNINSAGRIDTRIGGALISYHNVTSGMTGDLSKGEYYQYYYGYGINVSGVSWSAINGTGTDVCTTNPLSSPSCPNYFTAQCTVSPLYNPSCSGYAQAYFTQQCSANPLYDTQCPGYAQAYLDYQCSLDALYSTTCPGYEQAYFDKMCRENGLYSTQCPNYATAYATKMALNNTTTTTSTTTTSAPTTTTTASTSVAVVSDPTVNTVITSTSTSTSPAQSSTATVPLVQPSPTTTAPIAQVETKQEDKKDASSNSVSSTTTTQSTTTETKPSAPTARQELQARREAAAKAKAVEDGKNLANEMGKSVDMESQKQVQNVVIQAMGFTPGFDAYKTMIVPDSIGYKPYTVYTNQKNVDNKRLGMGLYGPSDRLHNELVDLQYK